MAAKASKQLESFIMQRKWDKVPILPPTAGIPNLWQQTYRIRTFLSVRDHCIKQPGNLTCYSKTIKKWNEMIKALNKKPRFSKEFGSYLTSQRDTFIAEIKQIKEEQIKKQEEGRIKREKIREEVRIKEEKEEQERFERERTREEAKIKKERERARKEAQIKREKEQEKARIKEWAKREKEEKKRKEEKAFKIVSNKAAKLGYKKVLKCGIAKFLYKVKREGGLKEGRNVLLWIRPKSTDAKVDKKFKISQIET
jgi:hypothetical protein